MCTVVFKKQKKIATKLSESNKKSVVASDKVLKIHHKIHHADEEHVNRRSASTKGSGRGDTITRRAVNSGLNTVLHRASQAGSSSAIHKSSGTPFSGSKKSRISAFKAGSGSGGELKIRSREIAEIKENLIVVNNLSGLPRREQIKSLVKDKHSEEELARFLADQYGFQIVDFSQLKPEADICSLVPKKVCQKFLLMPIMKISNVAIVAFSDPGDIEAKENVSLALGMKVQPVIALISEIKKMIEQMYEDSEESTDADDVFNVMDTDAAEAEKDSLNIVDLSSAQSEPVVNTVNKIITKGIRAGASDIHVEIYEKTFRVRFRVHGSLLEMGKLNQKLSMSIVNRIKILSQMDISERRLPQDGRMKVQLNNKVVDLRVSSVPVVHGEKVVMRILQSDTGAQGIDKLGMSKEQENLFKKYLNQSQGLILITGPTGSGKTTTIYSGLASLNTVDKNISTAEDPVEYKLQGVNQVPVQHKIGLSFSRILRTFLRQDPDIILVGEIRDQETADIAYRAAATGHLVLSTLHTNDTVSTVNRLVDIGVPTYSVSENTSLVIAQRLVRLLCEHCKEPHKMPKDELMSLGFTPEDAKKYAPNIMNKGTGCSNCNNSGYSGRKAVFELLDMTRKIKDHIIQKSDLKTLKDIAIKENGMVSIRQSAINYLKEGQTSVNEVLYGTMRDS